MDFYGENKKRRYDQNSGSKNGQQRPERDFDKDRKVSMRRDESDNNGRGDAVISNRCEGDRPRDDQITTIAEIDPSNCKGLCLKLQVQKVGKVESYDSKAKGPGKKLDITLIDATGEIRCTLFNEEIRKYENIFQVGSVLVILKSQIKSGNSNYQRLDMTIGQYAKVIDIAEEKGKVIQLKYNFMDSIKDVIKCEIESFVDVIGVIHEASELSTFKTRMGESLTKKGVILVDISMKFIEVSFWRDQASAFHGNVGSVLAIRGARAGEFREEKTLSLISSSKYQIDPPIDQANKLRDWYKLNSAKIPKSEKYKELSLRDIKSFNECETELAKLEVKGFSFKGIGRITKVENDLLLYKAEPSSGLKISPCDDGKWICEKNGKKFDTYEPRFISYVWISDLTGFRRVTVFKELQTIIGSSPQRIEELIKLGKQTEVDKILKDCAGKQFEFTYSVTEEKKEAGKESEIKYTVRSMSKVKYVSESRKLLEAIQVQMNERG